MVHEPTLRAKAAARGLRRVYFENFGVFLDACRAEDGFGDLAGAVGVRPSRPGDDPLSDDQFAVATLYAVVAFARE